VRKNGRVYIRNLKSGSRWYVAYYAPRDGRAVEHREPAPQNTEASALALLERRLRQIANHREGVTAFSGGRAERVLFSSLLADLETDYETKGRHSLQTMKYHVAPLRAYFRGRAASVTPALVQRYIRARQKEGLKPATIDRELELLRRAFALGIENRRIVYGPRVPRLLRPHENARRGFLERAEFEALLGAIADPDFRDYIEWFWWTGMRPGEIAALEWSDYDRQTGTLRVAPADAKIGEGRVVPVVGPVVAIIERRTAARRMDCRLIFHAEGESMGSEKGGLRDRYYDAWQKACAAVGLSGVIPYDLRRCAIRNLRAAGIPERVAMEISGHKTRSMFDRYGIVDERDLRSAIEKVGAYVAALPTERTVLPMRNTDKSTDARSVGRQKPKA
jgi:integrase